MLNNSEKNKKENGTEEEFLTMYLSGKTPVFVVNKKGEITEANNAFCKKLGVKTNDILGRNLADVNFLTEDAKKQTRYRHVSRLIGKETPFYTLETITKNGELEEHEIDTKPLLKNGQITGEISFIRKTTKKEPGEKKTLKKHKKVKKEEIRENMDLLNAREKLKTKDRELDQMKSELDNKHLNLETQKNEFEKISQRWKESEEEAQRRHGQIRELKDEVERIQNKLQTREKEIDDLREELRSNRSKLDERKYEIEKIRQKLKVVENEKNHREQELTNKLEQFKKLKS